jgi:hypothetical protein
MIPINSSPGFMTPASGAAMNAAMLQAESSAVYTRNIRPAARAYFIPFLFSLILLPPN